jgi:hypothetical protein
MAQVEYYFSRENLCQDSFLVSKMDAQHYVDVSIIADFKMVKQLTTDTELILSCVANSDKVSGEDRGLPGRGCGGRRGVACGCEVVNGGVWGGVQRVPGVWCGVQQEGCRRRRYISLWWGIVSARGGGAEGRDRVCGVQVIVDPGRKKMKPVAVNARTTLILRNIPTDAPETEVRALISGGKWPKIMSLRSDVGDNWFVSFETEEETKTALEMARGMKYKDKAISCAIKSENLLKGLQPGSPPKTGPTNGMYPGMYGGYMANGGYGGWNGAYAAGESGFTRGARAGGGARGGRAGPGAGAPTANGVTAEDGAARNGNKRNKPKAREGRDGQGSSPNADKKVEQAPINLNDFPSLAGSTPTAFRCGGAPHLSPRRPCADAARGD